MAIDNSDRTPTNARNSAPEPTQIVSRVPLAKLTPPAAMAAEIGRARLLERLDSSAAARVVLVRAPAGFGKTTTLAQIRKHLAHQGVETGWLTLDSADNDAARFVEGLRAAVSHSVGAHPGDAMPGVLEWLVARHGRFALFLDEFEAVHEPAVLALVRSLIDGLPQGSQVVIGSRSVPDLGLARLRMHGQLLELDADVLRFDIDETAHYLQRRHGTTLPAEAVGHLHRKTEGWIAGLWLASLSLERQPSVTAFVDRFSGSNRAVAEYLAEDVLGQQTPEIRKFLLRTSILKVLQPQLCEALVPGANATRILQTLEEQNVFLVALSGDQPAYRYHSLFAEFLRARLLSEQPDDIQRLHLAASAWYEGHGRPVPAIDHAIEGGDHPLGVSLLDRHAQALLEEGRMRLLASWFDAIPSEALAAYPRLRAVSVWASLFTRGPLRAAADLEALARAAGNDVGVRAHLDAQRPLILAMQDRYDEADAEGRVSLERLPSGNAFADGVLRNAMANVFTVLGKTQEAQRLIDEARRELSGSSFNKMYAESLEGMLDLQGGQLRQATARFKVAVTASHRCDYNYAAGNAWAGVLYARALYEADDFEAASRLVDVYLPLACDVGLPGHMIAGHLIRARIALHRGDVERAFEALTALEYLGHQRKLPRIVANAKLERARLLLLQGNSQASREELDRADDPGLWERLRRQRLAANEVDYLALARIRWDIHFGDARATLPLLESEIRDATAQSRQRRLLKLRVLHGLALLRSGDPAAALDSIATVVRQAAPEGFVRVIAEEGLEVGRLVQRLHAQLQEMPAKRSDPTFMEYLARLLRAFGPIPEDKAAADGHRLMEPLTRKEIQVLQLVADGFSNMAMAENLGLSESTVRTHLRSINTKLNAHSRAEAVAIARRLAVIR